MRRRLQERRSAQGWGDEWWEGLRAAERDWWADVFARWPRAHRQRSCAEREILLVCGCGPRWVPIYCDQRWSCELCRKRYYRTVYAKLRHGMARHAAGHFVTYGVPHSGSLAADERTLKRGWARWRALAQHHQGRSYPYVGVCELTASDGGHTHIHVVYHAPGRRPYGEWRRWFTRAVPGLQWVGLRPLYGVAGKRAAYLAKYMSKGVDAETMTPERAAELLSAWHGKRVVTASRGYFKGWQSGGCPKCGQRCSPGSVWDRFQSELRSK